MFQDFSALSYTTHILLFTTLIILFIYKYFTRKSNYWRKRNIFTPPSYPVVGNLWDTLAFKSSLGDLFRTIHNSTNEPFVGIYTFDEPALVIRDLEIIKTVLQKDFRYFSDRVLYAASHNQILNHLLFMQPGPIWKLTRSKMSQVFTSAKLRGSFDIIQSVCNEMVNYTKTKNEQDCQYLFQKFSTEVVTQVAYGINGQCFISENSEVYKQVRKLFDFTIRNAVVQSIYYFKNSLVDPLKLYFFEEKAINFFREFFWKSMEIGEKSNSIISLMHEFRRKDPTYGKYYC